MQQPDQADPQEQQVTDTHDELHERGTPPGMDVDDVEERSEIARFLGTSAFPSSGPDLVEVAAQNQATDAVLNRLRQLPEGEYTNMQDVARALGIGTEQQRT